jgi:hypothetical protein
VSLKSTRRKLVPLGTSLRTSVCQECEVCTLVDVRQLSPSPSQGCQMVYFCIKIANLVFLEGFGLENFGIFHDHSERFVGSKVNWYIFVVVWCMFYVLVY